MPQSWKIPNVYENTYPGGFAKFTVPKLEAWDRASDSESGIAREVEFVSDTKGSFLKGMTFRAMKGGSLQLSIECEPKDAMKLFSYLEDKKFEIDDPFRGARSFIFVSSVR